MNKCEISTALLASLLLLAACNSGRSPAKASSDDQHAPPPHKTVFDPYIQDLNKAKQVQDKLQAQQQRMEQQLQQAQSGTTRDQPAPAQPPRQ